MINRKNWRLAKAYLEYRLSVDQIAPQSAHVEATYIRHVLEWAQDNSFAWGPSVRPRLPEYMLSARLDDGEGQLSPVTIKKTLATARRFFSWLADNQPGYRVIKNSWISTLKARRLENAPNSAEAVSLEEMIAIANASVEDIRDRRIQATAIFLFLSGMRIGAFVTLPLEAVDIQNRTVKQFPNLGVKTKNRKIATTYLLPIPELLRVTERWDSHVRMVLPGNGLWFPKLSAQTGEINVHDLSPGLHRHNLARRNLKQWLLKVGLPYHSPHKFRHGHIHWAAQHAKDWADYKAVSLNVMHSSTVVTDQIYSQLKDRDVQTRIEALGNRPTGNDEDTDLSLLQDFLEWRKRTDK